MAKLIALLTITLFLGLTFGVNTRVHAETEQLIGFEAQYTVYRFGRRLGKARLSLKADEDNLYRLDYYSKVAAFFLSDIRSETSFFSFENNQLHPGSFFPRTLSRAGRWASVPGSFFPRTLWLFCPQNDSPDKIVPRHQNQ